MATPLGALRSLQSTLDGISSSIVNTRSQLASLQGDATAAEAQLRGLSSTADAAVAAAGRGATASQEALSLVERITTTANQAAENSATRLDDLTQLLANTQNVWAQQVVELVAAIKIGAAPVELLIQDFGDAMLGGERLVEFLRGADLHVYERQIRQLVIDLQTGAADVDAALKLLGESQLTVAKKLKETIELFRQGKVSLQFVVAFLEQIQEATRGSDFAELAGAIEDAIRRGELS